MKSKSSELLAAATVAALLCVGSVSRAQEEPKPPAKTPAASSTGSTATPAKTLSSKTPAATPAARSAAASQPSTAAGGQPAQSPAGRAKPAAALPARVRPDAGAHTNVETTEGLEKRASQNGKPVAATASPMSEPPK